MTNDEPLQKARDEVTHLTTALDLDDGVENYAHNIVEQWRDEERLASRPVVVNAAAAVVVTCRVRGLPYTSKDVSRHISEDVDPLPLTGRDNIENLKVHKYVERGEKDMISHLNLTPALTTPEDFVDRFCDELGLGQDVKDMTRKVIEVAEDGDPHIFNGRAPSGAASAAIWIASRLTGNPLSQEDPASVADVTTVTLRKVSDKIMIAIIQSDTDLREMMTTVELDGRLNQRLNKSRENLEADTGVAASD